MDLNKRKEFTPKEEDKPNQSSKKGVSTSKPFLSCFYLYLKTIEFLLYTVIIYHF